MTGRFRTYGADQVALAPTVHPDNQNQDKSRPRHHRMSSHHRPEIVVERRLPLVRKRVQRACDKCHSLKTKVLSRSVINI